MRTCHRYYPGKFNGACSLVYLHRLRPSPCNSQVGSPAIVFSGPAQRSLTLRPARSRSRLATLSIESSDSFVASAAVSIATGWSEPVPGREFHPLKSSAFSRRTVSPTSWATRRAVPLQSQFMTVLSELAARYWYVGGIGVSLIWFAAGKQSLSNKRSDAAIGWQAIAVIIALIVCGRSVVEKQWLGLALGVVAVFLEVRSIRRSTLDSSRQ
jgi:hypothetical protein